MRALPFLLAVAACSAPAKPAPAPAPPPAPVAKPEPPPAPKPEPPKDPRLAADLASFDKVWQTILDTFYDPKLGGVDWKAVRAELRPKVEASKDRKETRAVLNDMVGRLGKSHFGVWGAETDVDAPRGNADPGLDVRIVDGAALIFRLDPGASAAGVKGVKPGLSILAIDGADVAPKLASVAAELGTSTLVPVLQARAIEKLLKGPVESPVKLTLGDGTPKGKAEVILTRKPAAGRMVSLGNLGPVPLIYESKWLDKQTGYIRLSIWLDPATVMPAVQKDLAGFEKASGVVIDLRGNPGGIGAMAMGFAGYLVADANKKLGTMKTRQTSLDFVINPQAQRFAGKVAILIDESSVSTSEIFAGGMQDLGRARVFGRPSPGAALPSVIEKLPNGDNFQYAIADYVSASGKPLEGRGVQPDVAIRLDPKALRSGTDPDMVAAIRWLKEKS